MSAATTRAAAASLARSGSHVFSSASMALRLTQSVYRDTKGTCQRELAVVLH